MRTEVPVPRMRGVEQSDLGFLYHTASQWPDAWPRCCQKGVPSPHEFDAVLWFGVLAQYLVSVEIDDEDVPVGLVAVYDADHLHGTAWIESVGLPGDHHDAVMDRALGRMVDRAFTTWPFRKLYANHYSLRAPLFSGLSVPWREEARLADFYRSDGLLWDRVTTSIHRDDWAAAVAGGGASS